MKKRNRRASFEKFLPIKTENGIIVGHIPDDWSVKSVSVPEKLECGVCCQDPRNWIGVENFTPLAIPKSAEDYRENLMMFDPYIFKGYVAARRVKCKCGTIMAATEYKAG